MVNFNPISHDSLRSQFLYRNMQKNQNQLELAIERLSTGLRINQAADDPIGSARVNRFQTLSLSNRQAAANTQQALSLTDIASSGAQSVLDLLQKMRQLTLSSLNDTSTSADRLGYQENLALLIKDIEQVVNQTQFNSRQLLDGTAAGFRNFQPAYSQLNRNFTYDSLTTGNRFNFLTGSISVAPTIDTFDTFLFRTAFNPATLQYSLEVRSARSGAVAFYPDIALSPSTFQFSLPTATGSGLVSIVRSPFDFERITGPLTLAELNKPLQQLVNNDRLTPIQYGTLNLGLGPNTYAIAIDGGMSLQDLLNQINSLSSGPNLVTAVYDFGTGRIQLDYTGQAQNTSTNTTLYTVPAPVAAGGSFASYAAMPAPVQGPAYRDIPLPAPGFALSSPPANFPALPASLNTSISYTGSNATVTSLFGLSNAGNLGVVTDYQAGFYGETVEATLPSQYVNRTRVVISQVTAEQISNGVNTGLTAADANTPFQVLNTAKVTAPSFVAGDLTLDFGANGIFTTTLTPATTSLQNLLDDLNAFNPGNVSATYDDAADQLTLINTPPSLTLPKVNDPGLVAGNLEIDFGDNGIFNYAFDPGQTIADLEAALNGFHSNVSAVYDPVADTFSLSNTAAVNNQIVFAADPTSDGVRQFFQINNLASNGGGLQTAVSVGDIDNSSLDTRLDIANASSESFSQLITPMALPQNNQILFGGANGAAFAAFFKLSDAADNGLGTVQTLTSSSSIDNGLVDPSLELTLADRNLALESLRTPKLNTLVTGLLRINGQNIISINSATDTLNDVINAINLFSPSGNRSYSANFDTSVAGGISIAISDTETLSNAASQPSADPGGLTPTLVANQLSLDSAAYYATGAPVFQQPVYGPTALTPNPENTPYVTAPPTEPNVSAIQFSGTSNIASVLFLNNAASGVASVVSDEYQGTATAMSHSLYQLTGNQRRTFEASSSTTSSQRLGYDTSAIDESSLPADGIIGEVFIYPQVLPKLQDQSLYFQVDENPGSRLRVGIGDLSSRDLRLEGLKLYQDGDNSLQARLRGENALKTIDAAIENTLLALSQMGAAQEILSFNLTSLDDQAVLINQALSDQQDADIVSEAIQFTKAKVNVEVGAALIAQNSVDTRQLYDVLFSNSGVQFLNSIMNSRFYSNPFSD